MEVKSYSENVNKLIATSKSATVKNNTRQAKFAAISCPFQPVVTRLGSWLIAALHYAKNLPEVKVITESFEEPCILVSPAKLVCKSLV